MKKKYKKAIIGLGIGTVGLSIGSQVLGGIGGGVATKGQTGIYNVAKFAPVMGTIIGGGLTIGALEYLGKNIKKNKRRQK